MKLLIIFASLLVAINAVSEEQAWTDFKQTYSREYKSLREEKLRFQIFKSNLVTINDHNSRYDNGEVSYTLGVNQFADLTDEEFEGRYLSVSKPEINFTDSFEYPEGFIAPASFDWRTKGAVLSVKDQGTCASWYAFSALAAVEGQNVIKHNRSFDLSAQEIVDCSRSYGNDGCNGGLISNVFVYMQANGVAALNLYPYKGNVSGCMSYDLHRARVNVVGFRYMADSESLLETSVASLGPIAVGINASKMKLYKSGVFDDPLCGPELDHGLVVVGYGELNSKQYWIAKNSWGTTWGENGYILLSRNKKNQCGIGSMSFLPVIL